MRGYTVILKPLQNSCMVNHASAFLIPTHFVWFPKIVYYTPSVNKHFSWTVYDIFSNMFWLSKWDILSKHWIFETFRLCSSKISVSFCRFSLSWSLTSFDLCFVACIPGCWQNDPRQQVWYERQEGRLQGEGRGSKCTVMSMFITLNRKWN